MNNNYLTNKNKKPKKNTLFNKMSFHNLSCILIFICFFYFDSAFSQQEVYTNSKSETLVYTIENISDQNQLVNLQAEFEKIKGVSNVKTIYKPESGKGQIIFTFSEFVSGTENIENTNMLVFKELILKNNLNIVDFNVK